MHYMAVAYGEDVYNGSLYSNDNVSDSGGLVDTGMASIILILVGIGVILLTAIISYRRKHQVVKVYSAK